MRFAALLLMLAVSCDLHAQSSDGWITHATAGNRTPVVLHFRRELQLDRVPATLPVSVTADNRFVLYVNGVRMASGPSTGTVQRWRVSTRRSRAAAAPGRNVIAAVVWNFGDGSADVAADRGHRIPAHRCAAVDQRARLAREHRDRTFGDQGQRTDRLAVLRGQRARGHRRAHGGLGLAGSGRNRCGWTDAVPAVAAAARSLVEDPLPPQIFTPAAAGVVVRSALAGGERFPAQPVTVPANSSAKLLLRRDAMISAYPELEVAGGRDATHQARLRRGAVRRRAAARAIAISSDDRQAASASTTRSSRMAPRAASRRCGGARFVSSRSTSAPAPSH